MKLSKYSFLFYALSILPACSFSKSDIKEINSIQEVKSIFDQASQDDLFVFDVDQVILEPEEPIMQARFYNNPEFKKIIDDFYEFFKAKKNGEEHWDLFFSKMRLKLKAKPIEQTLIDNILALQKRNIKVIALTSLEPGKVGLIDRLEVWRYKQLLSLGLDFSTSFASQDIKFDELQKTEHAAKFKTKNGVASRSAVFYKGVACTGCFPKGIVLKTLLENVECKPSCIYFFDDHRKNVESVVEEMKKMGIKCQGFVYKAATVNQPMDGLDIEVARFQHELMKQHNDDDYVSYFEAKKILEQQKIVTKNQLKPIQATP